MLNKCLVKTEHAVFGSLSSSSNSISVLKHNYKPWSWESLSLSDRSLNFKKGWIFIYLLLFAFVVHIIMSPDPCEICANPSCYGCLDWERYRLNALIPSLKGGLFFNCFFFPHLYVWGIHGNNKTHPVIQQQAQKVPWLHGQQNEFWIAVTY